MKKGYGGKQDGRKRGRCLDRINTTQDSNKNPVKNSRMELNEILQN